MKTLMFILATFWFALMTATGETMFLAPGIASLVAAAGMVAIDVYYSESK